MTQPGGGKRARILELLRVPKRMETRKQSTYRIKHLLQFTTSIDAERAELCRARHKTGSFALNIVATDNFHRRLGAIVAEYAAITELPPTAHKKRRCVNVCVVCLENDATHAFIPCGHMVVCSACAPRLLGQNKTCPVCRAPPNSVTRIWL